jgi:hypothetical protein
MTMPTMARWLAVTTLISATMFTACVVPPPPPPGPITLAQVATMCATSTEEPATARLTTDLIDERTTVDLPDCVIHLENGAKVDLYKVTITGGILNIHDRDTDVAKNTIHLHRTTIDNDALLIEVNDDTDRISTDLSHITTKQGIVLAAAGTDQGANQGGTVFLESSTLQSTDVDAPISLVASEHSGTVKLDDTSVDTQGPLTVTAASCHARFSGDDLDCSTSALLEEIAPG